MLLSFLGSTSFRAGVRLLLAGAILCVTQSPPGCFPGSVEGAMDWSATQGYILTGGGKLEEYYNPPLFPWSRDELPHFHKVNGDTWKTFKGWKQQGRASSLVEGAWSRPLFVGGFKHTHAMTEEVFNLQSASLFIDLRIPRGPDFRGRRGFADLTDEDLRLLARRHCFAGYSLLNDAPFSLDNPPVCVRHHCIDWNFTGKMRPRPNKWRIELDSSREVWKEWGYARDAFGQHVYMERWERLPGGAGPSLALAHVDSTGAVDAVLIVQGDHFNFARDRPAAARVLAAQDPRVGDAAGLQAAVDALVAAGDRLLAEQLLSLEGCHGRTRAVGSRLAWTVDPHRGWRQPPRPARLALADPAARGQVDRALQPWREGEQLFSPTSTSAPTLRADGMVQWGSETWEVVENSFSRAALAALFEGSVEARSKL